MNEEMTMKEFMRIADILEKLGYDSDTILKMFKYIESGDKNLLKEITEKKSD